MRDRFPDGERTGGEDRSSSRGMVQGHMEQLNGHPLHVIMFSAMQPDYRHATPERGGDMNDLRILPSGAPMMGSPPFDRLFEAGAGQGLYALATSNWEIPLGEGAFFLKTIGRQALTRMAHAAAERPDEVGSVLDHLLPTIAERVSLAEQFPPVPGGEYITPSAIAGWLEDLRRLISKETETRGLTPAAWLNALGAPWDQIGKVFFHLAENRDDSTGSRPFAFMATFAHQSAADNQIRHLPLSTALKLHEGNHTALLAVLQPLKEAARESRLLQHLLESGKIYSPLAWSASEARDFLQDSPACERAGIMVRMVNLWKKAPPKLQVKVTADTADGEKKAHSSGLSIHSLLRFSVSATLGGRDLAPEELEELLGNGDGLIRFKGEWVRVDAQKVKDLMERWNKAARMMSSLGIPLVQGLRLLVNGPADRLAELPEPDEDCLMEPGSGLRSILDVLTGESPVSVPELAPHLHKLLRPYQKEGFAFLYRITTRGFGACLADDMGLGKTLQSIAWLDALRQEGRLNAIPALIVAPASLLANWKEEAERFAPELVLRIMHPSAADSWQPSQPEGSCHAVITTYGMVVRTPSLADLHFPAIILDEAQAIKNAGSARSRAVRALHGERRIALSGTPVENSLNEIWSLMEFLNPGLLGNKKSFEAFTRSLERGYAPLRRLIRPFILRRMKTDPALVPDLPDKTEIPAYCLLTPEQAALYQNQIDTLHALLDEPDPAKRLMLVLPILARLKQICNHPAQFQGTDDYAPERSGKFLRLQELCSSIAARQEKTILFTQFRSIIPHLHDLLAAVFGRPGLTLHGGTPIPERQEIVNAFQKESGPPFCILSLKAAGTGLTLTQASHVIHVDRWWNPAVENQATDRAYRIGQHQNVLVHRLICRGTIEDRIDAMLAKKSRMAEDLFSGGPEQWLMNMSAEELKAILCGD